MLYFPMGRYNKKTVVDNCYKAFFVVVVIEREKKNIILSLTKSSSQTNLTLLGEAGISLTCLAFNVNDLVDIIFLRV